MDTGFFLAQGYLLGAIIAPPDAVAASSVTKGLNIPKRITTVLEGESLVNDATSLIIYRYGLVAILTSQFVLWEAGLEFVGIALASVALGLVIGWVMLRVHQGHQPGYGYQYGHNLVDSVWVLSDCRRTRNFGRVGCRDSGPVYFCP